MNHSYSLESSLLLFLDLCRDADVRHSDSERSSRYAEAQDTDDSESLPPETPVLQAQRSHAPLGTPALPRAFGAPPDIRPFAALGPRACWGLRPQTPACVPQQLLYHSIFNVVLKGC